MQNFRSISKERKDAMRHVVDEWKRVKATTRILEEGLCLLASDGRPTADQFLRETDSKAAVLYGTWGKSWKSRLTLPKKDAAIMHDLVRKVKEVAKDEREAKKMVNKAFSFLLDGAMPPSTLKDPRWEPLLKILSGFDASVTQASLF